MGVKSPTLQQAHHQTAQSSKYNYITALTREVMMKFSSAFIYFMRMENVGYNNNSISNELIHMLLFQVKSFVVIPEV